MPAQMSNFLKLLNVERYTRWLRRQILLISQLPKPTEAHGDPLEFPKISRYPDGLIHRI